MFAGFSQHISSSYLASCSVFTFYFFLDFFPFILAIFFFRLLAGKDLDMLACGKAKEDKEELPTTDFESLTPRVAVLRSKGQRLSPLHYKMP